MRRIDYLSRNDLKVIVVDDHEVFRRGLIDLLQERGIHVAGEAAMATTAIELARVLGSVVVLMDLTLPGVSGIEATQRLALVAPMARVLVLTVKTDEQSVIDSLLAGACGYLLKDAPIDQIVEGIRAAARGEAMLSPRIASGLVRRMREPPLTQRAPCAVSMTPREGQVLELISRGLDNGGIARALSLSQHTVKNHVSSILVKLQVENRIQAAVRAVRGGLV